MHYIDIIIYDILFIANTYYIFYERSCNL